MHNSRSGIFIGKSLPFLFGLIVFLAPSVIQAEETEQELGKNNRCRPTLFGGNQGLPKRVSQYRVPRSSFPRGPQEPHYRRRAPTD